MRHLFTFLILVILASLAACSGSSAIEEVHLPLPVGVSFVQDFEDLLTDAEEVMLDGLLLGHEKETSNEIVIVTVADITPYDSLSHYSIALGNNWGVGKIESNNGVLIAVSENLRRIEIQKRPRYNTCFYR